MRIGIIGAGALGLTFAAALARANDVVLLARRPIVAELIARDGIAIEDDRGEVRHVAVRATADPRELSDRDAIIVAVKAYATAAALAPLHEVLAPHTLVASVQNGLGNVEAARTALPGARVIAGSTTQGAIRIGDARVRPVNAGTTIFERGSDELVAAFAAAGLDARAASDVDAILWRKLVVNAAINPVCALASCANGAVVEDPDLQALAGALLGEAAAVARAERIAIGDPWAAVVAAARASATNRNSMLQDLEAGRRTEIEAISGEIARRAATHGIAVPVTETVLRLVRGRERSTAEPRSKGTS